jgi:hypothetical protein
MCGCRRPEAPRAPPSNNLVQNRPREAVLLDEEGKALDGALKTVATL